MALWGKSELVYNTGKVNIHFAEKEIRRHSGTVDFVAAGIQTGDVISVGAASSLGGAVVASVVGVHTISIATTDSLINLGGNTITDQDYYVNEKPVSSLKDPQYEAPEVRTSGFSANPLTRTIVGVDPTEAGIAKTTSFAVQHAGWVGIMTYIDQHGTLRVKSETLVAFSGITSDREDAMYPDS